MAKIYLCFVWHMHQPFYKDLISGEYKLPWTRMHGLKDYYGMVKVLEDFPAVRQTFNLVPSMLVQIKEYADGVAVDPFLRIALKAAEELTLDEQAFMLQYFFQANVPRLIQRYPRYAELHEAWNNSNRNVARARRFFDTHALRDLQVLSQLAWFDEEFIENDPEVRQLIARGRDYSMHDQAVMGRKQREILNQVISVQKEFAARGQIEISTTPFYHPILPLLCNSEIASVAHPYVPLPPRFSYPQDARHQLETGRNYMADTLGTAPVGLWPSEGSVSDETLAIAADTGFKWAATDNGVLSRTLNYTAGVEETYRPYLWRQGGREIHMIFRDHFLSDLIGFVYSRMGAADAARHFLDRILENSRPIIASGRDALVPIILDGENAWEHYDKSGREFLRELYRKISESPEMEAITVSEALSKIDPQRLDHIFPGSWINANFDIWIGAEEDNRAWEYLLRVRQIYDRTEAPPEQKQLAYEELLIAEGSDWCWWYGPEHDSENRPEFDALYRAHLANVYRALGLAPPEDLSRPILRIATREFREAPTGPIQATIDGEITSYFEWLGAGFYRVEGRSGAMHGQRFLLRSLYYGSDGSNVYVRLDFDESTTEDISSMTVRLNLRPAPDRDPVLVELPLAGPHGDVECAYRKILECRLPLRQFGVPPNGTVAIQLSLWHDQLPMDALPPHGWIEFSTAEPADWFV
jgi:alpha-amylase/alpha-mannosidase (GH57 family)